MASSTGTCVPRRADDSGGEVILPLPLWGKQGREPLVTPPMVRTPMQARADRTGPTPQRPWFQVCQYGSSNAWLWHSTYRYEKGEVRTSPFRHPWDLPPLRLDRVIAHRAAILQVPPSNTRTSHTGPFRPPERAPRINRQRSSQLPRPARPPHPASPTGSPAPSGGCARSAPGRPRARRSR